jgi:hypothetical protein
LLNQQRIPENSLNSVGAGQAVAKAISASVKEMK